MRVCNSCYFNVFRSGMPWCYALREKHNALCENCCLVNNDARRRAIKLTANLYKLIAGNTELKKEPRDYTKAAFIHRWPYVKGMHAGFKAQIGFIGAVLV